MKSLPGKFASARGGTLLLILLLGAGLFVAACGDEEVPAPTTPAPPPPPPPAPVPEPEPEPEAPAVPVGLMISATGLDFIEWSWTPVEDVSGYDVQYSANQAFTDEDEVIARTAEEFSYRQEGLDPETSGYLRVRSASGTGDDRVTSDWSTHVTGTTMAAPPPPEPPAMPTGFMVSDTTETSITWTWDAVEGVIGYVVQVSMDEIFDDTILGNPETKLFDDLPFTTDTSYTAADLDPETTLYARVAAGAGTPTAPLVSAFTVHATGMTMAARLAAPANLEVKSRGHNFIEWQWDEVEGADGYQAQFSTDAGFSDPDNPLERPGVSNTSARVDNLESEADGYLRVRAYRGTLAARMFGDWSDADEATTDEPPPPEPLDAPENVRTSNVEDDSITLIWDEVDDAETYEVEFREEGASSWDDADCGNGSNVVTEEECVATGLDAGTDYDFQVRGIPAGDDDAHRLGAWSEFETRTAGTAAPEPRTPVGGGMGNLNVRWESTGTSITWIWDRIPGATYDFVVTPDEAFRAAENPCADADYSTDSGEEESSQTSHDLEGLTAGTNVRLLCVKTTNETNSVENLSYSWAATTPSVPSVPTDETETVATKMVTTVLKWSGIDLVPGFDYLMRVAADPHRTDAITDETGARAVQAACEAGTFVADGDTDVMIDDADQRVNRGLTPYTGYLLCLRYANQHGKTDWAVPTDNAQIYTAPARPPSPRPDSQQSMQDATTGNIVWTFGTRAVSTNVARLPAGFTAKTIRYRDRVADSDDVDGDNDTTELRGSKTPSVAACEETAGTAGENDAWTIADLAGGAISFDTSGIVVTASGADYARPAPGDPDAGHLRVRLCVQAKYPEDTALGDAGPWVLSGVVTVQKQTEN